MSLIVRIVDVYNIIFIDNIIVLTLNLSLSGLPILFGKQT